MAVTILAISQSSCSNSSDDNNNNNPNVETIKCKIAGVSKSFPIIATTESGGTSSIYGSIGPEDNPTETILLIMPAGETGLNKIESVTYMNPDGNSYTSIVDLASNVTTNNDTAIAGTFSATLIVDGGISTLVVTAKSFSTEL